MIDAAQVKEREEELQKAEATLKGNGGAALKAAYAGEEPAPPPAPPLKIDLGCGQTKPEGYTGVDFVAAPGVDVVHDLFTFPWPFADECADEVRASHFFEHVPGAVHVVVPGTEGAAMPRWRTVYPRNRFIEEIYRILKPGASAFIITPYGWSVRSMQDFSHEWPSIVAESYNYFNEPWRNANKLTHGHYDIACNFDVHFPSQVLDAAWGVRHPDALAYGVKHYINVVQDIVAQLVKQPRVPPPPPAEGEGG